METLKKWGMWIVGIIILIAGVFAAVDRKKEEPKADAENTDVTKAEVETAAVQHAEIVVEQAAVIAAVTKPIPPTNSANIDDTIAEWKNT